MCLEIIKLPDTLNLFICDLCGKVHFTVELNSILSPSCCALFRVYHTVSCLKTIFSIILYQDITKYNDLAIWGNAFSIRYNKPTKHRGIHRKRKSKMKCQMCNITKIYFKSCKVIPKTFCKTRFPMDYSKKFQL